MPEPVQPSLFFCPGCGGVAVTNTPKFADKLDAYRRMKGLTIAKLSAVTGVDADTMERLLAGSNKPNALNLVKIMRSLEIQFEPEDFE